MICETDRLILREFIPKDLETLATILGDDRVMEFSLNGALTFAETQVLLEERMLSAYQKYGFGLYAVIEKRQQKLIGFCGLIAQIIDGVEEVELAYRLAFDYWGKGLATEAAIAVRDYAANVLSLPRLVSIIAPMNTRSIRVAQKVGLTWEKDTVYKGFDVGIYSLINN